MKKNAVACAVLSLFLFNMNAYAKVKAIPSTVEGVQSEQDVKVLLETMNEVLEENRTIREQLEENEIALEKIARENSALKSQVKRMRRVAIESEDKEKEIVTQFEENIKSLETDVEKLSTENAELTAIKEYHETEMPKLIEESQRVKELLDNAVLKEERDEYLALIDSAQDMANNSFEEITINKKLNSQYKDALVDALYKLGNMQYDLKDLNGAISSYEKALAVDPQNAWVHHNLGIIYDYYIHDDKRAIYHYEQYLRLKSIREEADGIRERILEMKLKKNMKPDTPLSQDFYDNYAKTPR